MKGFFVTGTDTGVGKTTVCSRLAFILQNKGYDIGIMKPFATSNKIFNTLYKSQDTYELTKALNIRENDDEINPCFYTIPTAPLLANKILKLEEIDIEKVLSIFQNLSTKHKMVIVEGIGGIMVPIAKDYYLVDFIKSTKLNVIIVTTPRIGMINHLIMTYNVCLAHKINVSAILINKMPQKKNIIQRNLKDFIKDVIKFDSVYDLPKLNKNNEILFNYNLEPVVNTLMKKSNV